jgi:hypothetical protein
MSGRAEAVRDTAEARFEALAGTIDNKALYAGIAATFLVDCSSTSRGLRPDRERRQNRSERTRGRAGRP